MLVILKHDPNPAQLESLVSWLEEKGVSVLVCHVLRYAPFFKKVKSVIESGMLGEIVSVDLAEAIGNIHFYFFYIDNQAPMC